MSNFYNYLTSLPGFYVLTMVSFITISLSIVALQLVRRFIPHELRYRDNPVIGIVSSSIGLVYGVLAGLTALYLINNVNYTVDAVQREADAVANIYRDSSWLTPDVRQPIIILLKEYIKTVENVEWRQMEAGKQVHSQCDIIIDKINNELKQYKISSNSDVLILREMLEGMKDLYNAREQRIQMSYATLATELWMVILIGTVLLLSINYLFAMNLYMHMVSASALAIMASSMIYLLLSLDRPFAGDFVVQPEAFTTILNDINQPIK